MLLVEVKILINIIIQNYLIYFVYVELKFKLKYQIIWF